MRLVSDLALEEELEMLLEGPADNFYERWKKAVKEKNPDKYYDKEKGVFKGNPGTGERFVNCVLAMGARGYNINSALAICQKICNEKYGPHACIKIASIVRRKYKERE